MSVATLPEGVEVVGEGEARILAALWRVYADDGRATVRAVAAEADRSVGTTFGHLLALAEQGLVAGVGEGVAGALRPLCWPVPLA